MTDVPPRMHALTAKRMKLLDEREERLSERDRIVFTFAVQDLAERNVELSTGREMRTIKDLRQWIYRNFGAPEYLQRFTIRGRDYHGQEHDDTLISHAFGQRKKEVPDDKSQRVVHLRWMRDDDYIGIDHYHRHIHIPMNNIDKMREEHANDQYPYLTMTLRQWKMMAAKAVTSWKGHCDIDENHATHGAPRPDEGGYDSGDAKPQANEP